MFTEELRTIMSEIPHDEYTFIVGDLNIDLIGPSGAELDFVNMCQASSFNPMIEIPTRVTPNSVPRCLDHIWSNQLSETSSGSFMIDITDHYPVYTLFACERI